jgi:hypothetical protein
MITDNLSSHNSLEATTWLSAHPRLHHVFLHSHQSRLGSISRRAGWGLGEPS